MGDAVFEFFNSGGKSEPSAAKSGATADARAQTAAAGNDPVFDFLNSGGAGAKGETSTPAPAGKPAITTQPMDIMEADTGPLPGVVGHAITGIGANIIGGWRGLTTLLTTHDPEAAANAVRETVGERTYQPEAGTSAAKALELLDSPYNPMTWLPRGAKKAGEFAQDHGAGPGTAAAIETAINAVPIAIGVGRGGIAADAAAETNAAAALRTRVEPTLSDSTGEPTGVATIRQIPKREEITGRPLSATEPESKSASVGTAQFEHDIAQARVKAATDWETAQRDLTEALKNPETPQSTIESLQAKAATAEAASKKLELVPETGRARVEPPTPKAVLAEVPRFEEPAAEAGKTLPSSDQIARAGVLRRIGLTEARESAISGDAKAGATDYQTSKLDNPAGNYMRSVLDNERAALHQHAESIVQGTGGTLGMDGSAVYTRGNAILAPLDAFKNWIDAQTKKLYAEADARAGGTPVDLPKTHQFIGGDQAEFLGTTEGESLLRGVKARMKSLGMLDDNGAPKPVTIQQAEQLKQYLNNQWQPRTARLVRGMKDAIDDDVTQAAGVDIYNAARAMRRGRAVTLDDPNGIAKIMDSSGPEGINRAVPVEKVPDVVTGMPVDQLAHVIKTLRNVPDELQPQAQAAIAEIKAHFANQILDAGAKRVGQWGARDVTRYLNNNAAKLKLLFDENELSRIKDLNDAGHILMKDQSYPGAAAQEHNLMQRGVMAGVRMGAAGVGGFMGGGIGAIAGDAVGSAAAKAIGEKGALKATQKRIKQLSDYTDTTQ